MTLKTSVVTGDVFGPHRVDKKRPNAVHAKRHRRADGRPHRGGGSAEGITVHPVGAYFLDSITVEFLLHYPRTSGN